MQKLPEFDVKQEFYKQVKLFFFTSTFRIGREECFLQVRFLFLYLCDQFCSTVIAQRQKNFNVYQKNLLKIAKLTGPLPTPECETSTQFSSTGFRKQLVILTIQSNTINPKPKQSFKHIFLLLGTPWAKCPSASHLLLQNLLQREYFLNNRPRCLIPFWSSEQQKGADSQP